MVKLMGPAGAEVRAAVMAGTAVVAGKCHDAVVFREYNRPDADVALAM